MALKSTIVKTTLNVSDVDRGVYGDYALSIARHPSETEARMMLRVAVFARHAEERLEFGRGISTDDEPDIWLRDLTGDIELWIDLGTPDPDRLRKACGRAQRVVLYTYGERAQQVWWDKYARELDRFDKLAVMAISDHEVDAVSQLASTSLTLQATVSDGELWITDGQDSVEVRPRTLKEAAP